MIGILLSNLGTPDAPEPGAVRRYLREFLSDRRVIDLPRLPWWLLLNLLILPRRAPKSAALYRRVWTPEGSPLLAIGRRQAAALESALRARLGGELHVALGMRYGNPSIASAVEALGARGCRSILLLPLYPQYSATTSASTFDAFSAALARRRDLPEVRVVKDYHDEEAYLRSLAAAVREAWEGGGEPDRLLMSFHGLPKRYVAAGDPYEAQCRATARGVAELLGIAEPRWAIAFQSRFGREEWIQPYTEATLRAWGAAGVGSVDVVCPGFPADCLETLEEIALQGRELFLGAGGKRYRYLPALNDRDDHIAALTALAERHCAGWRRPRAG
ncbi:MAG: ferrochelatase [Planctomycetaceae bacterium]